MNPDDTPKRPRVAIACPGVGVVQRGYERLFRNIYDTVREDVDATLFKGGGPADARERVPVFLRRNGTFLSVLPIHRLVGRRAMHAECMTFALAMLPALRGGRFDIVHTIDPPLARILFKLRRALGMDFRLLFTHGCSMPAAHYPPADHVHEMAMTAHDEAIATGVLPRASLTHLPCGVELERFQTPKTREEVRREHGISPGTFVILSIAALDRRHKRTHHLVDEVAKLDGDVLLWLDGSLDQGDTDLPDYARSRLGSRVRVTQVPSVQVPELHRAADVMAHAALFEAFGIALAEAAASGVAMLVHDAPHFHWLLPNPRSWVDMSRPGALAARLQALRAEPALLEGLRGAEDARRRFAWTNLRQPYVDLYRRVAGMPVLGTGQRGVNYYYQLHG